MVATLIAMTQQDLPLSVLLLSLLGYTIRDINFWHKFYITISEEASGKVSQVKDFFGLFFL